MTLAPAPKIKQSLRSERHWRQRFEADAEFVFLKRLRMGDDPDKPFVFPGERLTDACKSKLGLARLKHWWSNKTIGLADWYTGIAPIEEPKVEGPVVTESSPNRYVVTLECGTVHKAHGKKNLSNLLAKLAEPDLRSRDAEALRAAATAES